MLALTTLCLGHRRLHVHQASVTAATVPAQPFWNSLQPWQRYLLARHGSTAPPPSSESYTQNSGCCNGWAVCELATLIPMAWVDILRQRLTLRQQQLLGDAVNPLQPAIRADSLAFFADQTAASHLRGVPLTLTATAKLAWLLGVSLCFYGGASAVSPGIEFPTCVQSSLATSCISQPCCSHLSLPSRRSFCLLHPPCTLGVRTAAPRVHSN